MRPPKRLLATRPRVRVASHPKKGVTGPRGLEGDNYVNSFKGTTRDTIWGTMRGTKISGNYHEAYDEGYYVTIGVVQGVP